MYTTFRILLVLFGFILLTVTTQIGGFVLLLSIWVGKAAMSNFRYRTVLLFSTFYLMATFLIVPIVAPLFGREKVTHLSGISPTNYATVLLNRNYACPALNLLLERTAERLKKDNMQLNYLDANFPFFDGFPLLPHLSHNDGHKIDLSLIYEDRNGVISTQQKSISGYGVFEGPLKHEWNQVSRCLEEGYFQYDYPKYLTFGRINNTLDFSDSGTKKLINALLQEAKLEKLFIEPHLKERLNLKDSRIRYHGCRAVRHDDHIHLQVSSKTN